MVLSGTANYGENYVVLSGYKWNLTQLLAHEMIHCYQFKRFGLLQSRPVANIPDWKWEGYPEYVARQNADQKDLRKNIARLLAAEKTENSGWILFDDGTGTVLPYYKSWLLVSYCLGVKKMTYTQLIADTVGEEAMMGEMMGWYGSEDMPL